MARHETTYGESSDEMDAAAGAGSLSRVTSNTMERERMNFASQHAAAQAAHEAASEEIARQHAALNQAKFDRQEAEAKFIADQRIARETRATAALKEMSGIDPAGPDAPSRLRKIQESYPDAFIGKESIEPHFREMSSRMEAHDKVRQMRADREAQQKTSTDAAKELGMVPKTIDAAGRVTYATDRVSRKENHEKEQNAIGKQMDYILSKKPVWEESTGLYKDEKGVQRFGYTNKMDASGKPASKDDPSTIATPEQAAQWERFQNLKNDYDLHGKALSEIRAGELKQPVATQPPANPNLPPEIPKELNIPVQEVDKPMVEPPAAPAAQQVDPTIALAQKALNDPAASEAHKAAARAILGIK